jgi:cell wall-associated NlpC family hydrolase
VRGGGRGRGTAGPGRLSTVANATHSASPLDPRVNAYRADLADAALRGRVVAARFVEPVMHACAVERAPMRAAPDASATAVSELLWGEGFAALDAADGWVWGWSVHDHYVGHVSADALGPAAPSPTHRVVAAHALLFAHPSIKAPVLARLPLGAPVAASGTGGDFLAGAGRGFLHRRHLAPWDVPEADPVAVAARLMGAPYLWGGRSAAGVDCSGLVQVALGLCGVAAPRDSDMQRETLGQAVDRAGPLQRGDLVFFPGHVGFMTGPTHLLHANAHWMAVTEEPLADVVARLKAAGVAQPVTAVRRL